MKYTRNNFIDEWEHRAKREGVSAVLSDKFPEETIDEISINYKNAVLNFIDEDFKDKELVEIGGGIGIFTKYFVEQGAHVTDVDVSEGMIERNKEYLKELSSKVNYVHSFFQDYKQDKKFDILVSSLVLIHNSNEIIAFTDKMKKCSDTIYIFESVPSRTDVSWITKSNTKEEYLSYFKEYELVKEDMYMLHEDKIIFLKLKRK